MEVENALLDVEDGDDGFNENPLVVQLRDEYDVLHAGIDSSWCDIDNDLVKKRTI